MTKYCKYVFENTNKSGHHVRNFYVIDKQCFAFVCSQYVDGSNGYVVNISKNIQILNSLDNDYKITLKCDAFLAELYRKQYPNDIVRGYHCPPIQAIYRNTVYINKTVDDKLIFEMIDHSYDEVIKSFSKKVQKEMSEN